MKIATLGAQLLRGITAVGICVTALSSTLSHAAVCGSTPLDITQSYSFVTTIDQPIENIVSYGVFECNSGGSGIYSVGAHGGSFDGYFPESSSNKPLSGLMIGTTHDLAGDPAGQRHIVLATSNAWAQSVVGNAFSTLFPNTSETAVIDALYVFATSNDPAELDAAVAVFGAFVFGELTNAFFNVGAVIPGQTTTSPFSVVTFNDASIIGTGIASLTTALPPDPVVPVPGVAVLLLAGFAALRLQKNEGR